MACGPLIRISARAETPGGVAQAVMVSFSNAMTANTFANFDALGRVQLIVPGLVPAVGSDPGSDPKVGGLVYGVRGR